MAGEFDKAKGRIKKAVGELIGNDKLKREGSIDKLSGNIKSGVDKVKKVLEGKKV
ncbi:MAG: CsbD family protein [Deltaproteobacteria bacterium]|nr:CsbD family protein [Deltaproteobacteria bacterium]